MNRSIQLFFAFSFFLPSIGIGQVLVQNNKISDISDKISYIVDTDCSIEYNQIIKSDFIAVDGLLNMGVSDACYWIKIELKNQSESDRFQLLIDHPILDEVEFYSEEGLVDVINDEMPFYERKYDDPSFIFDLNIPRNSNKIYYLKISGSEQVVLPLLIGSPDEITDLSLLKEMLFGIYAGIILVMFLYNIFVYFTVRDKSYLFYVLYIILIGITQVALKGYASKYIWPNSIWLHHYGVTLVSSLVGIAAILFVIEFLHSKEQDPLFHKISYFINGLFAVSIAFCLFQNVQISFQIMQLTTLLGTIFAFAIAIRILRKGFRPAKFFLIAWSVLLVGAVVFVLKDFGALPINMYTNYSLQASSILEVLLLSFALADKINILRMEKEQSQQEALIILKENERIVREQNVMLEAKVDERTNALRLANQDLNIALEDLKNTQSQLVSAEKMASLGQLTAGIAHEINNPINFVKSSVKPLMQNIQEITELLNSYDEEIKKVNKQEVIDKITALKNKIDFDYLMVETKEIVDGINEGATRTAEIVQGLRTFSHVDDIDIKSIDVRKGIDSTLKLLKNEINGEIKIEKLYGDIPNIECYGGKINQVFMNVLNNAVQAIKAKETKDGKIIISVNAHVDGIKIEVEDNGVGMDEKTRDHMFDPFFTTKEVGEGTGLGLSVVYGIIESHHGKLKVESELGKGTRFILNLPYVQPN